MVEFLTISWGIGIVGSFLAIIGLVFFAKGLLILKTDSQTKKGIIYMFTTATIVFISASIVIIFGMLKINMTNKFWYSFPILDIMMGITWFIGGYKLLQVVERGWE